VRQVKRQIIVDIEAGAERCEACNNQDGGYCCIFDSGLLNYDPYSPVNQAQRLPDCLESEAKLTRLVEAAGGITNWFNGRSPGFRERCSIERFNELAAALKEVKGE
jgi:hypothetical protein